MKAVKDSRPKREREKSSWQGKKSEEKEQKKCFEEEIVDTPFESNINTVVENISSEILHADVAVNE